jgi:hypothetical protein
MLSGVKEICQAGWDLDHIKDVRALRKLYVK